MRDYFQIAGELWTAVIVAFLLLAVAHYGYGQWLAYQQRKRDARMNRGMVRLRRDLAVARAQDFPRPMGVKPPEKGWIAESRFTLYAENEADAIDALMGKETADD